MPSFTVGGRTVFHRRGTKTQTISICTDEDLEGRYAERYGLDITVEVPVEELAAQPDLPALREWLVRHGGEPLPVDTGASVRMPPLVPAPAVDDPWVVQARAAVDAVLTETVTTFLEQPLLHRVEHSLHAQLWSDLKRQPGLDEQVALKDAPYRTQLVHKEWPETVPRLKADGTPRPRGLFDLAILAPDQVRQATPEQLTFGRIEAAIVVEVGLDYGSLHLHDDAAKLTNSRVPAGYLLHLSRLTDSKRDSTEALLEQPPAGVRTAYVLWDVRQRRRRWKHLDDAEVVHD